MNNLDFQSDSPASVRPGLLRTERKLREFAKYPDNWSYEKSVAPLPSVIASVRQLEREARFDGYRTTDVFPLNNGGLTLTVYDTNYSFNISVLPSLEVQIDQETADDIIEIAELATIEYAKWVLRKNAPNLWISYDSSKETTMQRKMNDFPATPSRSSRAVSPWSAYRAPKETVPIYARI